jgi:2OG-Fe(II) oxygenase superfamily
MMRLVFFLIGCLHGAYGFTSYIGSIGLVHQHQQQQPWQLLSSRRQRIPSPLAATTMKSATTTTTTTTVTKNDNNAILGPRLFIREDFPGLTRISSDPDIFVIEKFLDCEACQDLMDRANHKGLQPSPVAYAGWTQDFKDLVELAAKGPVTWMAIGIGWLQTKDVVTASQLDLVGHMIQNFVLLMAMAVLGIGLYTKSRADQLQQLRTSTSTTLDDLSNNNKEDNKKTIPGTLTFVRRTAELFTPSTSSSSSNTSEQRLLQQEEASLFEAPTVIRYEAGQVLAPHYDANRSAATEDANRGGQTLATLIVYLNDVQQGGLTQFGKLATTKISTNHDPPPQAVDVTREFLSIRPRKGDALLFFPADANGTFDERTEHEGCPAVDEKYIARIWRHQNRVPPPFGLSEEEIQRV